jgi:hypothetical protein
MDATGGHVMTTLKGHMRLIDMRTAGLRASIGSAAEWGEAASLTGAAGEAPTCTLGDDDDASVIEPYGLASHPASGDALTIAPEGDTDSLVALVSSVSGRPATQAGDVAVWSAGGHVIYLDDDGGLSITSAAGAVIDLPISGKITITAATLADIDLVVDVGQSVNAGGIGALPLTIWGPLSVAMTAMFAAGKLNPNGGPAFAAAELAWNTAIGALSPEAQKAKGV